MKYRKKPVVIDAVRFNGDNFAECEHFIGKDNYDNTLNYPNIVTLEGIMKVSEGDYIIKGVKGEFYPCKPDIFETTYEKVERKKNMWGADIEECDEFFYKITKNAGQRD